MSSLTETNVCNMALDYLDEAPIASLDSDTSPRALWLQRNYDTTRDALLRAHPWKFAIKRRRLFPGVFVMDGIGGTLSGAWGMFRLTEHWTGNLVTIRESAASTSDDFGVSDDNILVDIDGIDAFIGAGSGYVSQLYDQSNNAHPLVQATTSKQPLYDPEVGDAELPAAAFDGSNDHLATAAAMSTMISTTVGYMVVVGLIDALTLDSATSTSNALLAGGSAAKTGLYARLGGALYGMNDDGSVEANTDHAPLLVPFVAEWRHTGGLLYSRVNGGTELSVTSGTTASLAGNLNVGDLSGGSHPLDGNLFAILTFSSIPSEDDRNRLVERLMRLVGAGGMQPFAWDFAYKIPDDCLRMLPVRTNGEFEGDLIPHEIEHDSVILTDQATTLYARYIAQITDPGRFDAQFVEALASKLAFKMAHWLTGKASYSQTMQTIYAQAITEAERSNAFEGTPERAYDSDVINIRYQSGDSI